MNSGMAHILSALRLPAALDRLLPLCWEALVDSLREFG